MRGEKERMTDGQGSQWNIFNLKSGLRDDGKRKTKAGGESSGAKDGNKSHPKLFPSLSASAGAQITEGHIKASREVGLPGEES